MPLKGGEAAGLQDETKWRALQVHAMGITLSTMTARIASTTTRRRQTIILSVAIRRPICRITVPIAYHRRHHRQSQISTMGQSGHEEGRHGTCLGLVWPQNVHYHRQRDFGTRVGAAPVFARVMPASTSEMS